MTIWSWNYFLSHWSCDDVIQDFDLWRELNCWPTIVSACDEDEIDYISFVVLPNITIVF